MTTLGIWQHLYSTASLIQKTAPWEFLDESRIFGILDESSGMTVYVQSMGSLGEYCSLALYLGDDAINELLLLREGADADLFRLVDINHVQISFEKAGDISKHERKTLKSQGIGIKGRGVVPIVRRYGWTLFPYILTDEALAELVLRISPQIVAVFEAVRDSVVTMIQEPDLDNRVIPVLHQVERNEKRISWNMRTLDVAAGEPVDRAAPAVLAALRSVEPKDLAFQMMLLRLPEPVFEDGEIASEPYFPVVLLAADEGTGMLAPPIFMEHPLAAPFAANAQKAFAEMVTRNIGGLPAELTLWPPSFAWVLSPLLDELGIGDVEMSPDIIPGDLCAEMDAGAAMRPSDHAFLENNAPPWSDRRTPQDYEWDRIEPVVERFANAHFPPRTSPLFIELCEKLATNMYFSEGLELHEWTAAGLEYVLLDIVAPIQVGSETFFTTACPALAELLRALAQDGTLPKGETLAGRVEKIARKFIRRATVENKEWEQDKFVAMDAAHSGKLDLDDAEAVGDFLDELYEDEEDNAADDAWIGSQFEDGWIKHDGYGDYGGDPVGNAPPPLLFDPNPYVRPDPKIGRNAPCPCGSGKKYKTCCGK